MSRAKTMDDVAPEKLSEKTIEVNFIRRLAHCLEECRGVDRDDIVPLSPTQQEETKKGYDDLLGGVCVALQIKRPCGMDKGRAKFKIDLQQACSLRDNFPRGAAFYVLPPVGDLDGLVKILPTMLDATYIVDVHKLFPNNTPYNKHSCTLWIGLGGRIFVHEKGFWNGSNAGCPWLPRKVLGRDESYIHILNALSANVLCCKVRSIREGIGFSLRNGYIQYIVGGSKPENVQWEPWRPDAPRTVDGRHGARAAILHAVGKNRLALVCMGDSYKQGR